MILSDSDIAREIRCGGLNVTPLAEGALQPASVDIRLGDSFRVMRGTGEIDPERVTEDVYSKPIVVSPHEGICLPAGRFLLGTTLEWIEIGPRFACRLEGKSSLARIGLAVHVTGGWIDPGFKGEITVELANLGARPIRLRPGMFIGQLAFMHLFSPCRVSYGDERRNSRYQGQTGPTPSRCIAMSVDSEVAS